MQEVLMSLERKVFSLLDFIQKLQEHNNVLQRQNEALQLKLKQLEVRIEKDTEDISDVHKEKATIKVVVDDLIKSIDSIMENR